MILRIRRDLYQKDGADDDAKNGGREENGSNEDAFPLFTTSPPAKMERTGIYAAVQSLGR